MAGRRSSQNLSPTMQAIQSLRLDRVNFTSTTVPSAEEGPIASQRGGGDAPLSHEHGMCRGRSNACGQTLPYSAEQPLLSGRSPLMWEMESRQAMQ